MRDDQTPWPFAPVADEWLDDLRARSGTKLASISGKQLLSERAQLMALAPSAGQAPGGCRILTSRDSVIALNLPREDDWTLMPALTLGTVENVLPDDWATLSSAVARFDTLDLVSRGRSLGLAIASPDAQYNRIAPIPDNHRGRTPGRPRVIDLSALWAGPLATHLLWQCGAEVIKVESPRRPDGAREGHQDFYRLMNQGKLCVAVDLNEPSGRARLTELILSADIVIEASRPRALSQHGIDAKRITDAHPRMTWISITGHGRHHPNGQWIGYGDDAAFQAGMGELMRQACGSYQFAGDAIADPLTGIRVALAALAGWQAGGGGLMDLSLAGVAGYAIEHARATIGEPRILAALRQWWQSNQDRAPRTPRRHVTTFVAPVGADNSRLLKSH